MTQCCLLLQSQLMEEISSTKTRLTKIQFTQPQTIYGITKVFNEMMGNYYHRKFGVDFRGIIYPEVISSEKYKFNGTACYSTRKKPYI